LSFLGIPTAGEETEFPLSAEDRQAASKLVPRREELLIALHPGAADPAKRWPVVRCASLARQLQETAGAHIVLVGSATEAADNAKLKIMIGKNALDCTGKTSVRELGALLERAALLITTDSAPAHIAYALARPSVTLFGPTDPAEWGPLRGASHLCLRDSAGTEHIAEDDVCRAALKLLRDRGMLAGGDGALMLGRA
jgi:ADP-heptose:LPS heptosyltransferase